jgi:hypothetical protein
VVLSVRPSPIAGAARMNCFSRIIMDSFPRGIAVPEPLAQFFAWIGDRAVVRRKDHMFAFVDPDWTRSSLFVEPVRSGDSVAWTNSCDPEVSDRLAPFCATGGDGSRAALWRDDDGRTQIVHMGSGSGSTMAGVLVEDAIDFLRLLAIGYDELCWPEDHHQTPWSLYAKHRAELEAVDDAKGLEWFGEFDEPLQLRSWVSETFGVTVPATAAELVGNLGEMGDNSSDDPFLQWLSRIERQCD